MPWNKIDKPLMVYRFSNDVAEKMAKSLCFLAKNAIFK